MRLPIERITFLALCAVYDAANESRREPVASSAGLRLALAWLYGVSQGDKAVFDSFWETVRRQTPNDWASNGRYRRGSEARKLMRLIFRFVGQEQVEMQLDARRRP